MSSSAAILNRLIEPEVDDLSPEAAESILRFHFRDSDHARFDELSDKAKEDTLTVEEKAELQDYLRVADLLAILKLKARRSLQRSERAS